ncbi:MAG: bifunctional chorismate mutase/prephenate dehydratase, partial [Clostridiales bacterium]|nr:bifunctional chorismate mutase/prephenate dehydratase [Clostridiales bacterium]
MDLLELREQIDKIDKQIVDLYENRMDLAKQVAEYKIETGKKVFDKTREKEKIAAVKALVHNDFNRHGIEELFEQIMAMSRKLQYQMLSDNGGLGKLPFTKIPSIDQGTARVVFQGADGAYSQMAMEAYFGEAVRSFHVDTFRDAMNAIDEGSADFAVLPIENSSAGVVSEIYDLLVEFENYIVGEQIIQIEHCLLGLPGADKKSVKTVYSHPQSLMQSEKYLSEHENWKQISMHNNAFAARKVSEDQDLTQVAIASERAGNIYGLTVLEKAIQDNKSNSTRFIIVTNQKVFLKDAKKISICFEIEHQSGSLYRMLSHFIYNGLNMNK